MVTASCQSSLTHSSEHLREGLAGSEDLEVDVGVTVDRVDTDVSSELFLGSLQDHWRELDFKCGVRGCRQAPRIKSHSHPVCVDVAVHLKDAPDAHRLLLRAANLKSTCA